MLSAITRSAMPSRWKRIAPDRRAGRRAMNDLGELLGVFEVDCDEARIAGGPAQLRWSALEAADPHRDTQLLHWPRQEPHAVDRLVLAAVVHRFT
jgi:hypothetical protein